MPDFIECTTIHGNKKLIPKEQVFFRPCVYGLIAHEEKILVLKTMSSGKYCLPGGGINIGEPIDNALHREVKEETGITVKIDSFFRWQEYWWYYDPKDEATHRFLFYYLCTPTTFDLWTNDQIDDDDARDPQWIDITTLNPEDFVPLAQETITKFKQSYLVDHAKV